MVSFYSECTIALIFENLWQTLYGKDLDELGVVVPRVMEEISGPKVLVTERLTT